MDISVMEVAFHSFCPSCKYFDHAENEEPCSICLACSIREHTRVPLKYEKAPKKHKRSQKK